MSETNSTVRGSGFHYDPETEVCYRTLDFLGFPGYRVGDDGSVWSLWKKAMLKTGRGSCTVIGTQWRRLILCNGRDGRKLISLCRNKTVNKRYIHTIVLTAFVGPRPSGTECCHFPDSNPANNRVENLMWGTHEENESHKKIHGTNPIGERGPGAKLTENDVRDIRARYAAGGITQQEIANIYGIADSNVCIIINRGSWKHV